MGDESAHQILAYISQRFSCNDITFVSRKIPVSLTIGPEILPVSQIAKQDISGIVEQKDCSPHSPAQIVISAI